MSWRRARRDGRGLRGRDDRRAAPAPRRPALPVDESRVVLCVSTEGASDPESYAATVGGAVVGTDSPSDHRLAEP